jgi:hypothetical protein
MNAHSGARTCPASRDLLVRRVRESGWRVGTAAEALGISRRTASKWLRRFAEGGTCGLRDLSSRPRCVSGRTPRVWEDMIVLLRRTGMTGPQIARDLRRPRATVARVLRRAGLERLSKLRRWSPRTATSTGGPGICSTWT